MNTEHPEHDEHGPLERLASSLPEVEPSDGLWSRIETDLREIQRKSARQSEYGMLDRLAAIFRRPAIRMALYALLLLGGSGMGWYLLQDYGRRHDFISSEPEPSGDMLVQAKEDIEQAMFYYERAIEKLSIAAQERESDLDPQFVALQKEKIRLLRESISECKTTLRVNGLHPRVQHYLLAAYGDLQSTLQEMLSQQQ